MGELNISKSDTHATPSSGFQKLYPKMDGAWYTKKDDGSEETLLGAHATSHHVGGIDPLAHQSISGAGTNTHAQLDSHVASTSNPHSVTKTQVSLGNVTDDAQLKRADGDFATFTEKTAPVGADLLLIEDSAASGAKKKVQASNLPNMIRQVGFAEVTTDLTTTSTSFVDATPLTVTLTTATAGYFHIHFSVSADCSALQDVAFQVLLDTVVQRGVQIRVTNAQTNSGAIVLRRSASVGSHTIKVQWKTTGGTARITAATTPSLFHGSLLVEEVGV